VDTGDKLSEARNEVLQRIGRNLLFFQQIELILKYILKHGHFSGSLEEIQKMLTQWDRRSMGQLVEPFVERLFTPINFTEPQLDSKKVLFSHAFTVEFTSEQRAAFQQNIQALVVERNELAHHAITRFSLESVEQCAEACEALRQQRGKFLAFRNQIQDWAKSLTEFHVTIKKELEPGGFLDEEIRKQFR